LIDDIFVINPVAHAFNMTAENIQPNRYAEANRDTILAICDWQPPGIGLESPTDLLTDWKVETLAKTLFLETNVDLAAFHCLRLDSYFKDGGCSREKTVEAVTKYPDRFLAYVGLDPTAGLDVCMRELNEQLDEIPDAIGLKMYPAQVEPMRSWRADDPKLMFPLFECAQQRGIKTIAIHKAVPLGPVPMNPYRIDDLEGAATAFPDLAFEIIHAGLAFLDETASALARYPNVYANLEATMSLIVKAPRLFEQILATFLMWGGPQKIIYSDGCMGVHSQPLLELFMNFELGDESVKGLGVPQLTHEVKSLILGGNYARIIDLDVEEAKRRIADDEFAREVRASGLQPPYSNWKAELARRPDLVAAG
jgi:predicted TIM-barrel fold metal-dependent hydrolase